MLLSFFTAEMSQLCIWFLDKITAEHWAGDKCKQPAGYLQRSTGGAACTTASSESFLLENWPQAGLHKTAEGSDTFLHFVNPSQKKHQQEMLLK